jgi:hypothetical protein
MTNSLEILCGSNECRVITIKGFFFSASRKSSTIYDFESGAKPYKVFAGVLRQFLTDKAVDQESTHDATTEENAYIEALDSNIQRDVVERFESIYHAQMIVNCYYEWYNNQ